jgi:hypothetical protein
LCKYLVTAVTFLHDDLHCENGLCTESPDENTNNPG